MAHDSCEFMCVIKVKMIQVHIGLKRRRRRMSLAVSELGVLFRGYFEPRSNPRCSRKESKLGVASSFSKHAAAALHKASSMRRRSRRSRSTGRKENQTEELGEGEGEDRAEMPQDCRPLPALECCLHEKITMSPDSFAQSANAFTSVVHLAKATSRNLRYCTSSSIFFNVSRSLLAMLLRSASCSAALVSVDSGIPMSESMPSVGVSEGSALFGLHS